EFFPFSREGRACDTSVSRETLVSQTLPSRLKKLDQRESFFNRVQITLRQNVQHTVCDHRSAADGFVDFDLANDVFLFSVGKDMDVAVFSSDIDLAVNP